MTREVADHVFGLDATALTSAIRQGELTCAEVTRVYLDRIRDHQERLRAIITVNERAQAEAEALDAVPLDQRGLLHGVPLLIKDNIDVAGLPTTAGSFLMRDHIPAQDAPLVARLRAAGAVVLGKANMTEWANFMTVGMPNGYSSLGGQTVNPWGRGLDTSGSSSGSAVGVAARLCVAAIGTETSGSIVSPAHHNGVIGLKPTLGLVPRTGIVPISHTQDTAGPITRTARDAALLMAVICGPDGQDSASSTLPHLDFSLRPNALSGVRVALIDDESDLTEAAQQDLLRAQAILEEAGAVCTRLPFPTRAELRRNGWMLEVLSYEFADDLDAYLRSVSDGPCTLAAVVAGNEANAERCLVYGQTLLHASLGAQQVREPAGYRLARARDLELTRVRGFDVLFGNHDLVVFPAERGYGLAAKAGYPSVAVPVSRLEGRPGGVLMVAPALSDPLLLACAAQFNRLLGGLRFPPDPA